MIYYAHSGTVGDKRDWQTLKEHSLAVAELAAALAEPLGLGKAAYLAGLLHDLGKYTPEFQRRLEGADIRVDHSTAGAQLSLGDLAAGSEKSIAELIAYCIAGHHAGLPDRLNDTAACLNRRVEMPGNALDEIWKTELDAKAEGLVPAFMVNFRKADAAFQFSVMTRMIFSCLVNADFKDTERYYAALEGRQTDRQWETLQALLPQFLPAFDAYMAGKSSRDTELNRLRSDILAHVRGKAAERPGLFTLTVPTGGGKTLASLAFALDHAKLHGHRRIIYAIPFTGAWIETSHLRRAESSSPVAPSRGRGSKRQQTG